MRQGFKLELASMSEYRAMPRENGGTFTNKGNLKASMPNGDSQVNARQVMMPKRLSTWLAVI